jgi:hypothetical protein
LVETIVSFWLALTCSTPLCYFSMDLCLVLFIFGAPMRRFSLLLVSLFAFSSLHAADDVPADAKTFASALAISSSSVTGDCSVVRQLIQRPSSVSYFGAEAFSLPLSPSDFSRLSGICASEQALMKESNYATIRAEINHGEYLSRMLADEQVVAFRNLPHQN